MQKINEKRELTEKVLDNIGVSRHKPGYLYLTAIIAKLWEEKDVSQDKLMKYINIIAEEVDIFSGTIYSSMKYAIEEAWFLGDFKVIEYFFGYSVNKVMTDAPSIYEFVEKTISVLNDLEKNKSDIVAFLKFIRGGGMALKPVPKVSIVNKNKNNVNL